MTEPAKPPPVLLRLSDVSVRLGAAGYRALDGVSFELHAGERVALLGPSGCGKTTCLRAIAGFEPLQGGSVELDGQVLSAPGTHVPPYKRRVGMVFQDFALFPHLDVEQNLAFGLTHLQPEARAGRVRSVLSLCGLSGLERRRPSQLSGGQQQRVALARALAPHPRLLLLDEPFASLDANLRATTREQTAAVLHKVGATALLVTHDQEEAMCFAERLVVLRDGRIEQQGTPEQVYRSPKNAFVATFLGEANVLRVEAQGRRAQSAFGSVELQTEASGSVQICIRPEAIELQPPVGQALTARITSREYLGSRFVYRVRQNEREWLVASGADRPWSVGEAVALVVRSPAAVLDGE